MQVDTTAALQPKQRIEWIPDCLEAWHKLDICPQMRGAFADVKVNVVLPWINGSDALLDLWRQEARQRYLSQKPVKGPKGPRIEQGLIRHYRQHDELRYSLRSIRAASAKHGLFDSIHVISADVPARQLPHQGHVSPNDTYLGQVPTWLSPNASSASTPRLVFRHHSQLLNRSITTQLPLFNSLAIEAALSGLSGTSDLVWYTNDDVFMLGDLSLSDVGTPLTGSVFRLQRDLVVHGTPPWEFAGDDQGEWPSLAHSNYLLDERFGKRYRFYLAHVAKAWNMPILREVAHIWREEFEKTTQSQFRGQADEIQVSFLLTHYIIEKHREALLFSYFVARADQDLDGTLSMTERRSMLEDLGMANRDVVEAIVPERTSLDGLTRQRSAAGLVEPQMTKYEFTSFDGYAGFQTEGRFGPSMDAAQWPTTSRANLSAPVCEIRLETCFGKSFRDEQTKVSTNDVFRRVAFEQPSCGDCVLLHLIGKSGPRGLSAILPADIASVKEADRRVPVMPVHAFAAKRWQDVDYVSVARRHRNDLRLLVLTLLQRYAYTIGSTPTRLISMRMQSTLRSLLSQISSGIADMFRRPRPKEAQANMFAINDDLPASEREVRDVDRILKFMFDHLYPDPAPWEQS